MEDRELTEEEMYDEAIELLFPNADAEEIEEELLSRIAE